MSKVASGLSSILNILYAPLIFALVLGYAYHTDPISVLFQGPAGWAKYGIAVFISVIVTFLAVTVTMRGGKRAIGI